MDAQRHEVYAELYQPHLADLEVLRPAAVGEPGDIIRSWQPVLEGDASRRLLLAGDGALAYRAAAEAGFPGAAFVDPVPPLTPAIARLAERRAGLAVAPHAVRPVYVRRPDAELARDRRATAGTTPAEGPHRA